MGSYFPPQVYRAKNRLHKQAGKQGGQGGEEEQGKYEPSAIFFIVIFMKMIIIIIRLLHIRFMIRFKQGARKCL